jgi:hypothetical protein
LAGSINADYKSLKAAGHFRKAAPSEADPQLAAFPVLRGKLPDSETPTIVHETDEKSR